MPTNAEVIAQALVDEGIETIFGLPGGEALYLMDACRRAGIRFLLTGHEASAAFMADVTGQITGRAGVCISTLGPGAMNLAVGVANAYLERSPVLALTAQISHTLYDSFTHQRVPLDRVFEGITKRTVFLDGNDSDAIMEDALRLARSDRPGPVHLALPGDLATREVQSSGRRTGAEARATPVGASIEEFLGRIREARRPLVLIGLGARPEDAAAVRYFLDVTQIPWVTTPKGKGIAPETHSRFLGVASGMAIDKIVTETIAMSDLLIGIGFDPVECQDTWFLTQPVVNVGRWVSAEGRYRPVEVVGDIGVIEMRLASEIAAAPWPEDLLAERRRAIARVPSECEECLSPLATLRALREVLPEESVMTCDVGSHKLLTGQFWQTTVPGTFFMSNGLSSMGYAVPAAVAASLQFPDRPVASVVGDGGMLMMANNLPLIAAHKLPILTVVFTEGSLALIRLSQARKGLPRHGTDFTPPDFTALARSCGIAAARADSLDEVKKFADRALGSNAPFLLEVPVDFEEYVELI